MNSKAVEQNQDEFSTALYLGVIAKYTMIGFGLGVILYLLSFGLVSLTGIWIPLRSMPTRLIPFILILGSSIGIPLMMSANALLRLFRMQRIYEPGRCIRFSEVDRWSWALIWLPFLTLTSANLVGNLAMTSHFPSVAASIALSSLLAVVHITLLTVAAIATSYLSHLDFGGNE